MNLISIQSQCFCRYSSKIALYLAWLINCREAKYSTSPDTVKHLHSMMLPPTGGCEFILLPLSYGVFGNTLYGPYQKSAAESVDGTIHIKRFRFLCYNRFFFFFKSWILFLLLPLVPHLVVILSQKPHERHWSLWFITSENLKKGAHYVGNFNCNRIFLFVHLFWLGTLVLTNV